MSQVDQYLERVLKQTQSQKDEREEVREELRSHLLEAKNDYMAEGFTDEEAEQKALSDFGEARTIGKNLQEAMYPFQRGLLYILGIALIIYGSLFYLNMAFNVNETIPGWLAIQFVFGGVFVLFAMNISYLGRHFYALHILIVVTLIWSGFNLMTVETVSSNGYNVFFSIYLMIFILVGLIFMFRNSYYSTAASQTQPQHSKALIIVSYMSNLLFGISHILIGLFFMWAMLFFSGLNGWLFVPFIPMVGWLIFYKFQMRHIAKRPFQSIWLGLIFSILIIGLPLGIIYLI